MQRSMGAMETIVEEGHFLTDPSHGFMNQVHLLEVSYVLGLVCLHA